MASTLKAIKSEPSCTVRPYQTCRLCMSDESHHDVFRENGLHQWISDYLSIKVSVDDHMSQTICTICQIRLTEFHQFRTRCLEVQNVLQTMIPQTDDDKDKTGKAIGEALYTSESVPSCDVEENHKIEIYHNKHTDQIDGFEDVFVVEEVKIELRTEDCTEQLRILPNETVAAGLKPNNSINSFESVSNPEDVAVKMQDCYACPICTCTFSQHYQLTKHMLDIHNEVAEKVHPSFRKTDEQYVKCDICHKLLPSDIRTLKRHERHSHRIKELKCPICDKLFAYRKNVDRHIKNHHPLGPKLEKPFQCDVCQRKFKLKEYLIDHKKRKHGTKAHECPICGRPFAYRQNMLFHMQIHQSARQQSKIVKKIRTAEAFTCEICSRAFNSIKRLDSHKWSAHAQKNYGCDICGIRFIRGSSLIKHMERHNRDKKWSQDDSQDSSGQQMLDEPSGSQGKCVICHEVFENQEHIRFHYRTVHRKQYKCPVCRQTFITYKPFEKHMLKQHKQNIESLSKRSNGADEELKRTMISQTEQNPGRSSEGK